MNDPRQGELGLRDGVNDQNGHDSTGGQQGRREQDGATDLHMKTQVFPGAFDGAEAEKKRGRTLLGLGSARLRRRARHGEPGAFSKGARGKRSARRWRRRQR
jgi:hypothetical protein